MINKPEVSYQMEYPGSKAPINEFEFDGLLTMAFPHLFPDGRGDPTIRTRNIRVSFEEGVKHLLKFYEFDSITNNTNIGLPKTSGSYSAV